MPEMSGIDAIIELKKNPKTSAIPIIVSTGVMTSSHNLKTALESGAIDFIRKPVDMIELKARVNSVLMFVKSNHELIEQRERMHKEEADKLKNELEFKSRELINNALYISKYSEKMEKLIEDVKALYPYLNQTGNKKLYQIIQDYVNDVNHLYWPDFELHFEEIYPGFFKRLTEKCPHLTATEKRLCAFIKLNMNSKDIAQITYQTPESINVTRSRLRSKLGLERDENLYVFLNSL